MAMDLKITTGSARAELSQLVAAVDNLQAKLSALAASNGLNTLGAKLSGVQGINPGVASSIQSVVNAVNAAGAQSAASAAQMNASLSRMSSQLLFTNSTLQSFTDRLRSAGTAAQGAGGHFGGLHAGISRLNGVLGVFGASLSLASFGDFIRDSMKAVEVMDKFNAQMTNIGGSKMAGAQLEFLKAVARETGQALGDLVGSYGQFAQSAMYAGLSAEDTGTVFLKASGAFRALGLSADQTKGAFKALEQMYTKGRVQLEELTGQLGDRGVPALAAMAKGAGMTKEALLAMAQQGALGTSKIKLMIDALADFTKQGLEAQLRSWSAAVANFNTALFQVRLTLGTDFFAAAREGMYSFAQALSSLPVLDLVAKIGAVTGAITSVFAYGIGQALMFVGMFTSALNYVWQGLSVVGALLQPIGAMFTSLGQTIYNMLPAWAQTALSLQNVVILAGLVVGAFVTWAVITAVVWTVQAALAAVRAVLVATQLASMTTLAGFVAMTAGMLALVAAALAVTDYLGLTEGKFKAFANTLTEAGEKAIDLAKKLPLPTAEVGTMTDAMGKAKTQSIGLANGMSGVESAAASALPVWGYTTEAVNRNTQEMNQMYDSGQRAVQMLIDGQGAASAWASGLDGASSSANGLSNSLNGVAGRLNTVFAASEAVYKSIGKWGDMGPGMLGTSGSMAKGTKGSLFSESLFNTFAEGGVVGSGSPTRARAPLAAFVNAPHYASGTSNTSFGGGGMPAILHPNEAVIPLSRGRFVPVEMRGSFRDAGAQDTLGFEGINITLASNRAAASADATRICDKLTIINATLSSLKTSSTMSTTVSSATTPKDLATVSQDTVQKAASSSRSSDVGGPDNEAKKWAAALKNEIANYGRFYGYSDSAGGNTKPADAGAGVGTRWDAPQQFADGSPNASRDARRNGGFIAMLHPDEAVIPLPDGRRVPVDLRSDNRQASRGDTSIVVNMTVVTKDADSFAKSEDQILQNLRRKLDRATRNIGLTSEVEDPTQRVKA